MRLQRLTAVGLAVLAVVVFAACRGNNAPTASNTPAGGEAGADGSALGEARLDAAKKLGVDAFKVELKSLKAAGWDGCMGVKQSGKACPEIFTPGYVALFEGAGKQLRYHVAGSKWVGPVDPAKADDGSPIENELDVDLLEALVRYARHDWSLRTRANPTSHVVEAVVPATGDAHAIDSYVRMSVRDLSQWYRVGLSGIAQVPPPDASTLPPAAKEADDLEQRIREDMATRGKGYVSDVSVLSYRLVTWPDGCLGIQKPGQFCTQALVPGFLAKIAAGGDVYRYHGANGTFTNATLQAGATLTNPGPR